MTNGRNLSFEQQYLKELDEQLEMLNAAMVRGAQDWPQYQNMVGQYRGLMVAKARFEDMVKLMEAAN